VILQRTSLLNESKKRKIHKRCIDVAVRVEEIIVALIQKDLVTIKIDGIVHRGGRENVFLQKLLERLHVPSNS
jgi:hypothetical protein